MQLNSRNYQLFKKFQSVSKSSIHWKLITTTIHHSNFYSSLNPFANISSKPDPVIKPKTHTITNNTYRKSALNTRTFATTLDLKLMARVRLFRVFVVLPVYLMILLWFIEDWLTDWWGVSCLLLLRSLQQEGRRAMGNSLIANDEQRMLIGFLPTYLFVLHE